MLSPADITILKNKIKRMEILLVVFVLLLIFLSLIFINEQSKKKPTCELSIPRNISFENCTLVRECTKLFGLTNLEIICSLDEFEERLKEYKNKYEKLRKEYEEKLRIHNQSGIAKP